MLCNKIIDISGTTCCIEELSKEDSLTLKYRKLVVDRLGGETGVGHHWR